MKHKSYESYTTENLKDIYCISNCDKKRRKNCEKEGLCLEWLSTNAQRKIAGTSLFQSLSLKEELKVRDAVEKWRKKMLRKCRKVRLTVEETT